uniref:Uncharacterized protein n=1 Tax=Alexandrium monilatum TaxID=311494 RepID=A0A7S4RSK7_9DINO
MASVRRLYGVLVLALLVVAMQIKDPLTLRLHLWSQAAWSTTGAITAASSSSGTSSTTSAERRSTSSALVVRTTSRAPATTTAPPTAEVPRTSPSVPTQAGCGMTCMLKGMAATCQARIQWSADNVFNADPDPCAAARRLVLEECSSSCAPCTPAASAATCTRPPAPPACGAVCELHGQFATCRDRVQWAVENIHRGSPNACWAAHSMVLGECPVCAQCALKEVDCRAAPPAPAPPLLIKIRFDGSAVPLGFGPWRTLGSFVQKRCFWGQPAWRAYVSLHRRILQGEETPRYLIFERNTMGQGIGATLRGLYLCLYLAMAAGRALLIDWETPVQLEDVFNPGEVDWRWSKHRTKVEKLGSANRKRASYVNLEQNSYNQDVLWKSVNSKAQAVFLETNLDAIAWLDRMTFEALGAGGLTLRRLVREYNRISGCAFHSLFRFRERGAFAGLWRQVDETVPAGPRIGIHLRVGDVSWSKDSTDRRPVIFDAQWGLKKPEEAARQAVECAQQTARQVGLTAPCTIVFESDNDGSKRAAREAGKAGGPCKCWTSSSSPTHERHTVDHQRTRETWVALVMLSSVEILISSQSTFSYTAGSIGPGLVEPRRHVDFEAALKRRLHRKRSREDMRDLCRFE